MFASKSYFIHILTNLFNVSIVLSWSWIIFNLFLIFLVLNNFGRWSRGLNKLDCRMHIICSNRWIRVRFPLVFSSYSHFLIWTVSEWLNMTIILTWIRPFILFLIWRLFANKKSFISLWFGLWQCLVNIVLTRSWIETRLEIVFVFCKCQHLGGIQRSLKNLTAMNLLLARTSI